MKSHRLHFVGIGGIGMSGIAEIFLSRGMRVSGSDLAPNETTERLVRMGAEVFSGHERSHVRDVDVVVISSAVKSDNPEVLEARRRPTGVTATLHKLVGLDAKLRQYEVGEAFVVAIEREAGPRAIDAAWRGPEWLPTTAELTAPTEWLARVA